MASGIKVNGVDLDSIFVPLESFPTSNVEYKVGGVDISQRYEPLVDNQLSFNTNLKHNNVDLRYIFQAASYIPPTSTPVSPTPTPTPVTPTPTPVTPTPTPTPVPITCHWSDDGEVTINYGDVAAFRVYFDTGNAPFTVEWYDGSFNLLSVRNNLNYPYDEYVAGVVTSGYHQYYAVVKNAYNSVGVNPSPHADFRLTVNAPVPTETPTPTPTETPTPTPTETPTPTPTETPTPTPEPTETPTPEPTPTPTPEPTSTPTPEPTPTPTPEPTPTPTPCYSIEVTYDGNGRAAMTGLYCDGSDASFDTEEGAGTEGDVAFTGCIKDGFIVTFGSTNIIDNCT
jgi:hypothetical protein